MRNTAGGTIPKRLPPGLPAPSSAAVTATVSVLDSIAVPSASRDNDYRRVQDTSGASVMPSTSGYAQPSLGPRISTDEVFSVGHTLAPILGYTHDPRISAVHEVGIGSVGNNVPNRLGTYSSAAAPSHDLGYVAQNDRRCRPCPDYSVHALQNQAPGVPAATSDTRSDTTGPCNDQLAKLIGVLQAPKVTIPLFDGNPMSYNRFIRAFEDNVERVIDDDASRLARLAQQCTGGSAGYRLLHDYATG